ncbi:MAG TPA: hypothetical protein VGO52_11445 [Hyphomonadaceae bacterium]|jgi:hypothetical protein|nr:hypothetical protein [Hyphomonadaceae bacterium]
MSPFAFAQTRMAVPGGGSVIVPSPFDRKPSYPTYADRTGGDVLIGYRNWRSTMSGYPECDGMLGVGRNDKFRDLADFVGSCKSGVSVQWSDADRIPGQAWDGNEKRFERKLSADGGELTQQLSVHRVGFFGTYDEASHLFAVRHGSGVSAALWLYDKHGGVDGARKSAHRIAASFQP